MINDNLKNKKSMQIFKQIIEDIKTQKLNCGDILPSEAELSKKYEVGRGSIREAMHALEALGIVKKKVGIGTQIEDLTLKSIFNPADLLFKLDYKNLKQVLDFREIFEVFTAKMLPEAITDTDIKKIEEILALNKFYFERNDKEKFSEYDYKFHQALANSTHNVVIVGMFNMIYPFIKIILSETVNIPENLNDTLNEHFEILEAIKSNNGKVAEVILKRHIRHVKEFLKESIENEETKKKLVQ